MPTPKDLKNKIESAVREVYEDLKQHRVVTPVKTVEDATKYALTALSGQGCRGQNG